MTCKRIRLRCFFIITDWFFETIPFFTKASGVLKFYWKLFERVTACYEKTFPDLLECDHLALNPIPFSEAKIGFFITSRYLRVLSEKIKHTWSDSFPKKAKYLPLF